MKLSEMTDREILVHLVYRIRGIERRLDIKDKRAWALTVVLIGAVCSAIVALLLR